MRLKVIAVFLCVLALVGINEMLSAATVSGMVTVTRNASRAIVSAVLETTNRDSAGNPVTYNIVMDENGHAIAQQYENKDVKIEGTISGKDVKAETWSGIRQPASPEPAYSEPEPDYSSDSSDSDDEEDNEEPEEKEDSDDDEEKEEVEEPEEKEDSDNED
jgi:hypothetical protein